MVLVVAGNVHARVHMRMPCVGMSAHSLQRHQCMRTQGKGSSHLVSADSGSMILRGVASAWGVDTSWEMMITRMSRPVFEGRYLLCDAWRSASRDAVRCRWWMFLEWPFRYDIAQPAPSVSEDLSKLCASMTQSSEHSRDSEGGGGRSCGVSPLKQFSSSMFQRQWLWRMPIGTA